MNHAENDVIIELLTGKIRRGNQDIALPERESALLFACAIRPEVLPRERLTEQLWPNLSDTAARNAFHVCLHRLKRHLQQDIIIHTKNGYRLSGEVRVDLWEIERATTSLHTHEPLDDAQATSLRQLFERLAAAQPTHFEKWEWLAATERRVSELRAEIAHTLARHALVTKRENDALSLSHTLIGHDPYDESAHEIAISAHLSMGNSAAALRHFRRYRETLKADLDCEPSSRLTLLIDVKA
jgi:DNA-binding SARP family transcriptional activator